MAFKFFNVGLANKRIEELEAENARLSKETSDLKAAVESNGSEIEQQAADLAKQLDAEKQTSSAMAAELNKTKETITAQASEIKALKERLDAKEQEVQTEAAKKALEIQASIGHPSRPSAPKEAKEAKESRSGLGRVLAAASEDLTKAGYVPKR
jgi:DNA repair exonuclease SbcCD ATPase subunit